MMKVQGWHIVILIVLAMLLFGAPRLPGLARSVGQSLRIFRSEVRQMKDENPAPAAEDAATGSAVPVIPAPVPPVSVVPAQNGQISGT